MLQRLTIHNYAIIDRLEIEFSRRLNILTGETGAGKSIIMGALGLILGDRADSGVLVDKKNKCIVEGTFHPGSNYSVKEFLDKNGLDSADEIVLRREIATSGKSRAFINDTPVNLSQMQQAGNLLVDLHQQFDNQELGRSDFQRDVLDALAGNAALVSDYRNLYGRWQTVKKEWEFLLAQKQQSDKEADYLQFQFKELEEAGLKENELELMDAELKLLSNAENIKGVLSGICMALQDGEAPLVQQLKSLLNQLSNYQSFHPHLPALADRLQSARIELQDIADEMAGINSQVVYDPSRIEQLNERSLQGYKLLKKHGVSTTGELLQIQQQLKEKLQSMVNLDDSIREKEKQQEELKGLVLESALKISSLRARQADPLAMEVNKLLVQVGMPNARLKVGMTRLEEPVDSGIDGVEFLFNANIPAGESAKGEMYLPVGKVASGGELSRLMLCIKSLVAQSMDLPTLIFDEIDTGISGEAARQVGNIMKELAASRQVICITHQPQIAGKADSHFFVYKENVSNTIKTNIRLLSTEERITAIATMLAGDKPTKAAIQNAREMVGQ